MYTQAGHRSNPFHAGHKSNSFQHVNLLQLEVPDWVLAGFNLLLSSLMHTCMHMCTDTGHGPNSFLPVSLLKLEVFYWPRALAGLLLSSRRTANLYRSSKHS